MQAIFFAAIRADLLGLEVQSIPEMTGAEV
jgi:hypothetical protein